MIGNPDSKYTYNPGQLDIDIHNKKLEHEACKQAIRDIILALHTPKTAGWILEKLLNLWKV